MMKIEKCDKCGSWINDKGECYCGTWSENFRDVPILCTMEKALLAYDNMKEQENSDSPLTMDHWSGNCAVFFKGDYELCMKVKKFIEDDTPCEKPVITGIYGSKEPMFQTISSEEINCKKD